MALFPEIEPYRSGTLPVSGGHTVYWEESGNPAGRAVLFLHGGPGSGSTPRHRRYYDPAVWRIIQLDQRGCGQSTPRFSLLDNTTQHLIADIEALRQHLGIERWTLFGPSWGSTLAIAAAQAHPDRVSALVVAGIFLGTRAEIDWWHGRTGAAALFPDAHARLMQGVPDRFHDAPAGFIAWALDQMRDELARGAPCLKALDDPDAPLEQLRESLVYRWSEYEEQLSHMEISPQEIRASFIMKGRDWLTSHSLIEAHYFANDCFLAPGQLLADTARLTMPVRILQGRYDLVCPFRSAWALKAALPAAELTTIPAHGHAMGPPVFAALRDIFTALAATPD